MDYVLFFPNYVRWHYGRAFHDMYIIWGNFFWFLFNLFSIEVLFGTLFSPWRRMTDEYTGGLDIGAFFESLIVNMLMRVVGIVLRLSVILVGVILLAIVCILGIVGFVIWLFLPVIIFLGFVFGIVVLIS